ncbi:MAG: hypothetical protein EOP84_34480 [Verrucomicrobiaceae bacterium]|nr:MAG: hypothetical protein EOP84_34480 [Verrucomicrobiaceae bacterium]
MNPSTNHPCPCCGYRTYLKPAGGTMQLCPVCGWEDAPGEYPFNNSNDISLVEGQRHFLMHGACEAELGSLVRKPLPEEERSIHWMSLDQLRERIIQAIEEAFHGVTRNGGITLHQMDLVDGGWPILDSAMRETATKDPELRWQDISAEKLSKFYMSLSFLDDKGYLFYLPAFMRHAMMTATSDLSCSEHEGALWSLDSGPEDKYRRDAFALLDIPQRQAIAAFVQIFILCAEDCLSCRSLKKQTRNSWNADLPSFFKLALT